MIAMPGISLYIMVGLCCLCPLLIASPAGNDRTTIVPDFLSHVPQCEGLGGSMEKQQFEDNLDIQQEPCEDFWAYACGNWHVPNHLRSFNPSDTLSAMKAANKHLLMQHFDEADGKDISCRLASERAVIRFYRSCLDKRAGRSKMQDEQAIRLYTDVLQQFTTPWPILHSDFSPSRVEKNFNWEFVAAKMLRYGAQSLMKTSVQPNWQSSQQLIVYLMPPSFELLKAEQSDVTFDEESAFLYQRYVKLLLLDLGVKVRKANEIAEDVVEFEKGLMSLVSNEDLLILKEPQTLATLASDLPQVDLLKYFSTLLEDVPVPKDYEKKMLIVADKNYLKKLVPYLSSTKVGTIANYLMVQFLLHFEINLHDDESYLKQKEDCLMQVDEFMPAELMRVFLELQHGNAEEFLQKTHEHLGGIFENLKRQFEKMFNTTTVFERDMRSRNLSIEKIRNMRLLLPKLEAATNANLDKEIGNIYDQNLMTLSKMRTLREIREIVPHIVEDVSDIPMDSNLSQSSMLLDRSYGPLNVNAYYRLKTNAIKLPIGILGRPLYDRCLKPAKVYGGLVYTLAHELVHGFDYDGLNYDKSGNVHNGWGPKAIIKFGVKSSCYLNERYENGQVTINENIADSEGLRLALETLLDSELGLDFDQDDVKLFFLSFAQTWCGQRPSSSGSVREHASHQQRVNNVLGNFMEFADIYQCRPSTRLHPEEKCRIW